MPFPNDKNLAADKDSWLAKAVDQKLLESTSYSICSFYEGFTVLQIFGEESKEYFFGNYFNGRYCGHIYMGRKFTQVEVAAACNIYMPPELKDLHEYELKFGDKVWYHVYTEDQYAWIFNQVVTKV